MAMEKSVCGVGVDLRGEHLRLSMQRRTAVALGLLALIFIGWCCAATSLVLKPQAISASEDTRALQDEIVSLRSELERVTSRTLVERQTVSDRLQSLLRRQAELEDRQTRLNAAGLPPSSDNSPAR